MSLSKDDRRIMQQFLISPTWQRLVSELAKCSPALSEASEPAVLIIANRAMMRAGHEQCLVDIVRLSILDQPEEELEKPVATDTTDLPADIDAHTD